MLFQSKVYLDSEWTLCFFFSEAPPAYQKTGRRGHRDPYARSAHESPMSAESMVSWELGLSACDAAHL